MQYVKLIIPYFIIFTSIGRIKLFSPYETVKETEASQEVKQLVLEIGRDVLEDFS